MSLERSFTLVTHHLDQKYRKTLKDELKLDRGNAQSPFAVGKARLWIEARTHGGHVGDGGPRVRTTDASRRGGGGAARRRGHVLLQPAPVQGRRHGFSEAAQAARLRQP